MPVYNVSLPLMTKLNAERPFHLEEVPVAAAKTPRFAGDRGSLTDCRRLVSETDPGRPRS